MPTDLSPETLAALPGLLDAATPGPWRDDIEADDWSVDRYDDDADSGLAHKAVGRMDGYPVALAVVRSAFGLDHKLDANAALIALAPALARAVLAAEVEKERLREVARRLVDALDGCRVHGDFAYFPARGRAWDMLVALDALRAALATPAREGGG